MSLIDRINQVNEKSKIRKARMYKEQEIRLGELFLLNSEKSVVSYISQSLKDYTKFNSLKFSKTILGFNTRWCLEYKDRLGNFISGCEHEIVFNIGEYEIRIWLSNNHLDLQKLIVSQNDLDNHKYLYDIIFKNPEFKLDKDDYAILNDGIIGTELSKDILTISNTLTGSVTLLKTIIINGKIWTSEDLCFSSFNDAMKFVGRIKGWDIPTTQNWEDLFVNIEKAKQYDFVVNEGISGLNLGKHEFYWGNDFNDVKNKNSKEIMASRISTWEAHPDEDPYISIQGGYVQSGLNEEYIVRLIKN